MAGELQMTIRHTDGVFGLEFDLEDGVAEPVTVESLCQAGWAGPFLDKVGKYFIAPGGTKVGLNGRETEKDRGETPTDVLGRGF